MIWLIQISNISTKFIVKTISLIFRVKNHFSIYLYTRQYHAVKKSSKVKKPLCICNENHSYKYYRPEYLDGIISIILDSFNQINREMFISLHVIYIDRLTWLHLFVHPLFPTRLCIQSPRLTSLAQECVCNIHLLNSWCHESG